MGSWNEMKRKEYKVKKVENKVKEYKVISSNLTPIISVI